MTNRERVIESLAHRKPDKVPYHISFTSEARRKTAAYLEDDRFEENIGNAFAVMSLRRKVGYRELRPCLWQDEFGVIYDQTHDKDIGVVANRVVSAENADAYPFPDPDNPERYAGVDELITSHPDRYVIINHGFSLFERAWALAGMEEVFIAMFENSGFVDTLFDRILAYNLRLIENFCSFGIDAMMFGDDWGAQNGLIMGPALWRKFIKPRIKTMYEAVKAKGKQVFIHSCGDITEIIPDIIELGVDVLNPFQPETLDVYALKRRYGRQITFYGGISTQKTLPFGSPHDVEEEVRSLLTHLGRDGGFIASPAHAVPADAKPENIVRMIRILNEQEYM